MTTHNNNTNQNNNTAAQSLFGIRGQVLTYKDNPLLVPAADCYDYYPDGLVVVRDGVIDAVGAYGDVIGRYPGLDRVDTYENAVVMPGFIDCHLQESSHISSMPRSASQPSSSFALVASA